MSMIDIAEVVYKLAAEYEDNGREESPSSPQHAYLQPISKLPTDSAIQLLSSNSVILAISLHL